MKSARWVLKDLGRPGGIELYPLDPFKEGWQKLD